jgi:hypothetical protein
LARLGGGRSRTLGRACRGVGRVGHVC